MSFNNTFRHMCFTLKCSQHLATGPHLEPDASNPHAHKLLYDVSEVNLAG